MSAGAAFAQALLVGLSIAAPVGPIGLLTIQRTLDAGWRVGLATGLGAAVADAAYGAIGAWGVSAVMQALAGARVPLGLFGGLFLVALGWRSLRAGVTGPDAAGAAPTPGVARAFAGSVALTLANPATILSFVAVFAALGARPGGAAPGPMVAGVFVGSALWWLVLASSVARLRRRLSARALAGVRRFSGALLVAFGLWQGAVVLGA